MKYLQRIALLVLIVMLIAATYNNIRDSTAIWITNSTNVSNNAGILSSTITNSTKYILTDIEFNGPSWSGSISVNGAISVWLCGEVDGTNFEDCDTTNFSPRPPDVVFPLRAANAAQRIIRRNVVMPPGDFKVLMKNESGVSLNGGTTPWTIKGKPSTLQSQ
jgi:hypothetical protein